MTKKLFHFRFVFVLVVLAVFAVRELALERRPSWLRPDLKLCAYVANTVDGTVSVVDLVSLRVRATVSVGPGPSGLRAHPQRKEIWGVSTQAGYVWVLDAPSNTVVARIPVGSQPFAIDFAPDGSRAYVAASGSNSLVAIDCATKQVIARARTGRRPWIARVTPDGRTVAVTNRDDATLQVFDVATLALRATIPTAAAPEQFIITDDSLTAYISATGTNQLSVVDLRHNVLLTDLPLPGKAEAMFLKPDGGELYVTVPDAHGLTIINTYTHEVADSILLGAAPTRGVLDAETSVLYVSDAAAGHVIPVDMDYRAVETPIKVGEHPGSCRMDPGETHNLLLVVDEGSNDLAVIPSERSTNRSFITLIPLGNSPGDLAIKLF